MQKKVQYKAYLAITGAIQGISRENIYEELGLNLLVEGRWCSKLISFYKTVNGLLHFYLHSYLHFTFQYKSP